MNQSINELECDATDYATAAQIAGLLELGKRQEKPTI